MIHNFYPVSVPARAPTSLLSSASPAPRLPTTTGTGSTQSSLRSYEPWKSACSVGPGDLRTFLNSKKRREKSFVNCLYRDENLQDWWILPHFDVIWTPGPKTMEKEPCSVWNTTPVVSHSCLNCMIPFCLYRCMSSCMRWLLWCKLAIYPNSNVFL
jgi:hypothetical protein